jgi:hypothetical protein
MAMVAPMPTSPIAVLALHVIDSRAPQDVQAQLERNTDAVFAPLGNEDDLVRSAMIRCGMLQYRLTLTLVNVLPQGNSFRLDVAAFAHEGHADEQALLRHAQAWIGVWTHGLQTVPRPAAGEGSASRRQALARAWRAAEVPLGQIATLQQSIVQAMRHGATFSTAHKEGGSNIRFDGRRYEHTEYGENQSIRHYASDAQFLDFLRQFFDYETSRHVWPARVPEVDAWRLILRRVRPPGGNAAAGGSARSGALARLATPGTAAVAVAVLVALGLSCLKWQPKADAMLAGKQPVPLHRLPAMPPALTR